MKKVLIETGWQSEFIGLAYVLVALKWHFWSIRLDSCIWSWHPWWAFSNPWTG